jgi:hypothetical protein
MVTDAMRALVVPLLRQQITEVCEKSAAIPVEIIQALWRGLRQVAVKQLLYSLSHGAAL